MRVSAIIVAAGSGSRLGRPEPKAFVQLGGYPMLHYSLKTAASVASIEEIVVAVPAGSEAAARAAADATTAGKIPIKIIPGGTERQDSVRIALALTSAEAEFVIIHDAARPFADHSLFAACLEAAARADGAIAAIEVADTLKRVTDDTISATVPRAGLWQAQTPQAFRREILAKAHRRATESGIVATDDADLVERIGGRIRVVRSSALNFKITTPADLAIAEALIAALPD